MNPLARSVWMAPAASTAVEPPQDALVALVRLALGRGAMPAARLEAVEAAVEDREVGEDQLEIESLEIPGRIDGAGRVGHGRVIERSDDVEERIRFTKPGEM